MRRPFRAIGLDSFILYGIEWETAFVSASSYILAPLKSSLRTIDNRRNSGCPGKGEGSVWIRYLGVGQRFRLWNSSLPIPLPPLLNQSETRSLTEISLLIPLMTYRFRQLTTIFKIFIKVSPLSFFFPRVFGKMTRTFKNLKRKKLESRKNWEIFV